MGRGRQKAKQTKVARKIKYYSPDTDLEALAREISGANKSESSHDEYEDKYADPYADKYEDDPYAEYVDKYANVDEDDWADWAKRS